jgi:nitrogen fixation/metabolism regulation signal transduction histidine kinase
VKTLRTHPDYFIINVRGLILIYVLLCVLTILFSRSFFMEVLREGAPPGVFHFVIFFTIPLILLVFLAAAILNMVRDNLTHRTGGKFQARLFGYFIVSVFFAALPVTIITIQSAYEIIGFWRSIRIQAVLEEAQHFAMDAYSYRLEHLEGLIRAGAYDAPPGQDPPAPPAGELEIRGVQDFYWDEENGLWISHSFAGESDCTLPAPPGAGRGFSAREIPRDTDLIRYVFSPGQGYLRVITCALGEGFDQAIGLIGEEKNRMEIIGALEMNLRPLAVFYYGVFFFPTLLMTVIITISFTRRVTQPIVELTEATRRVAEGDFSIQILSRPGDELGLLVSSFNSMVRDLEHSRGALVRAEKISLWQSMAQQLAHEIKNPLTPIKLSAERVLRRWRNDPGALGEIVESSMLAIIQEVEGLSTMLTEFRTLSRPMEPSLARTQLGEQVEETIGLYQSSYPGIRFDLSHLDRNISVKIDKRHIAQVLTNLIINSIDAMGGKGLIEIRTDLVKKRGSRYCRLSIRDTGKGITEEEGAHVFTPYFTTKKKGTGLGLPIVERIVTDHGGAIWFNSAPLLGTTFFIDLPVDDTPVAQTAAQIAAQNPEPENKRTEDHDHHTYN